MMEIDMIIYQLRVDLLKLENGENVSLCAKWCPSENSQFSYYAKQIGERMFPQSKTQMKDYRTKVLIPLRRKIDIVERHMSANEWNTINYETTPSKAMRLYRKSFETHDEERFKHFQNRLKNGEAKINVGGTTAHDLVRQTLCINYDIIIEHQWQTICTNMKECGVLSGYLPVVDVSGSMYGTPMEVAIALGLMTSLLNEGPFNRKMITFSHYPTLVTVEGDNLEEQVQFVQSMDWGTNTDIIAVFKLIIDFGKAMNVSNEQMPKNVIVFTDMQFDSASFYQNGRSNLNTTYEIVKQMYHESNYTPPNFIFWNLRTSVSAFPVESTTEGTAIVSGYSQELLKSFMNGKLIQSPIEMLNDILEPYENVVDQDEKEHKFK